MSTPLRFVVWLFLTAPVTFGAGALGYFLPSALKIHLLMMMMPLMPLASACNLLVGWLFGLFRFHNRIEIGTSILVIFFALSMPTVLLGLVIIGSVFCGIDAC